MAFSWRWFLVLLALLLSGERNFAASARENRALASAASAFSTEMYPRAATELGEFIEKYPDSTNTPQARLLLAEAEFKQGKFPLAIWLLTSTNATMKAGALADQYAYWAGEAQFAENDLTNAIATFVAFPNKFPDSPLKLRVVVETASAYVQLGDWPQVGGLLEDTNGVFQRAAQMDAANELVSRGQLLRAQARFVSNDFTGAAAILAALNSQTLMPELDWQRAYLLYQVKMAAGDLNAALAATTNMLSVAKLKNDAVLRAESVAMRAELLEKSERAAEAVAAYSENLATNAPEQRQREAVLKIAALSIAQKQFTNAEQSLGNFIAQFTNSPAADVALLTLGELYLKDYVAQPLATNNLVLASGAFTQFLGAFTNSPLAGKAFLDRGWCDSLAGKTDESLADFKAAAQRLPPSEDLAVARFKIGDALFAQNDYAGALTNYRAVLDGFTNFPAVAQTLGEQALYQSLRANLALNDLPGANGTLARILTNYPAGDLSDNAILLFGENLADARRPADARELFEQFEKQSPDSELWPQTELAIARTYEQETNWPAAITNYEGWLKNFPTNSLQPQADYALALANFQAGNETNAFVQFTNFVAQFPTNELAPLAQWWVADHFYRAGDFFHAEYNYKVLFQTWQSSGLADQARMMAGRAAMGRPDYADAINYFTTLVSDTNCPPDLKVLAQFAWGGALMLSDSPDKSNPLQNYSDATNVFVQICQAYPTNEWGALAWGEMGDCYLQLTNYDAATNAFAQVFSTNSPANISARSRAQIEFGMALEKKAALAAGDEQRALLELAKNDYADVLFTKNLRDGEIADSFWIKNAGLKAALAAETLGEWDQAEDIYAELKKWLPQLGDSLGKKIAEANTHLPQKKN
jgi:TolA-binding protein